MTENIRTMAPADLDRLCRQLRRYAHSRLRDPDVVDEVVQETFMAALGSASSFHGRSKLGTWLIAILRNKIVDHIRGAASTRRLMVNCHPPADLEGDDDRDGLRGLAYEGIDDWSDPRRVMDARQTLDAVAQVLKRLPARSAAVFVLADVQGCNTRELCSEFNLRPDNLGVVLHRARKAVRREMAALSMAV